MARNYPEKYVEKYVEKFKRFTFSCLDLTEYEEDEDGGLRYLNVSDGDKVTMGGMITAISKKTTKTGQGMAFITVEDVYGAIDCVMFPKIYERFKDKVEIDAIIEVDGRMSLREGEKPAITVDKIKIFNDDGEEDEVEEAVVSKPAVQREREILYIKLDDPALQNDVLDTLESYPGNVEVKLVIEGKPYNVSEKVRLTKALYYELYGILDEKNVVVVKK